MKPPERVWSRSLPSHQELLEFLQALDRCGISLSTRCLFEHLASRPPGLRLAFNLKSFLGETVVHEVLNVLSEGLAPDERKALLELDAAGLSVPQREVAHGLLAVHERWMLWKALRRSMSEARAASDHFVERRLLDELLGGDT